MEPVIIHRGINYGDIEGAKDYTDSKISELELLPEAPEDGKQYARQDGDWSEVDESVTPTPVAPDDEAVTGDYADAAATYTALEGFAHTYEESTGGSAGVDARDKTSASNFNKIVFDPDHVPAGKGNNYYAIVYYRFDPNLTHMDLTVGNRSIIIEGATQGSGWNHVLMQDGTTYADDTWTDDNGVVWTWTQATTTLEADQTVQLQEVDDIGDFPPNVVTYFDTEDNTQTIDLIDLGTRITSIFHRITTVETDKANIFKRYLPAFAIGAKLGDLHVTVDLQAIIDNDKDGQDVTDLITDSDDKALTISGTGSSLHVDYDGTDLIVDGEIVDDTTWRWADGTTLVSEANPANFKVNQYYIPYDPELIMALIGALSGSVIPTVGDNKESIVKLIDFVHNEVVGVPVDYTTSAVMAGLHTETIISLADIYETGTLKVGDFVTNEHFHRKGVVTDIDQPIASTPFALGASSTYPINDIEVVDMSTINPTSQSSTDELTFAFAPYTWSMGSIRNNYKAPTRVIAYWYTPSGTDTIYLDTQTTDVDNDLLTYTASTKTFTFKIPQTITDYTRTNGNLDATVITQTGGNDGIQIETIAEADPVKKFDELHSTDFNGNVTASSVTAVFANKGLTGASVTLNGDLFTSLPTTNTVTGTIRQGASGTIYFDGIRDTVTGDIWDAVADATATTTNYVLRTVAKNYPRMGPNPDGVYGPSLIFDGQGNAYDTGIPASSGLRIETTILPEDGYPTQVPFGSVETSTPLKTIGFVIGTADTSWRWDYNATQNGSFTGTPYKNNKVPIKLRGEDNQLYINDTLVKTITKATWESDQTIWIGCRNGIMNYPCKGRIFNFKITRISDGEVLLDATPVGTEGNTGNFYDSVSQSNLNFVQPISDMDSHYSASYNVPYNLNYFPTGQTGEVRTHYLAVNANDIPDNFPVPVTSTTRMHVTTRFTNTGAGTQELNVSIYNDAQNSDVIFSRYFLSKTTPYNGSFNGWKASKVVQTGMLLDTTTDNWARIGRFSGTGVTLFDYELSYRPNGSGNAGRFTGQAEIYHSLNTNGQITLQQTKSNNAHSVPAYRQVTTQLVVTTDGGVYAKFKGQGQYSIRIRPIASDTTFTYDWALLGSGTPLPSTIYAQAWAGGSTEIINFERLTGNMDLHLPTYWQRYTYTGPLSANGNQVLGTPNYIKKIIDFKVRNSLSGGGDAAGRLLNCTSLAKEGVLVAPAYYDNVSSSWEIDVEYVKTGYELKPLYAEVISPSQIALVTDKLAAAGTRVPANWEYNVDDGEMVLNGDFDTVTLGTGANLGKEILTVNGGNMFQPGRPITITYTPTTNIPTAADGGGPLAGFYEYPVINN
jgi:hypothetical protein